LNARQLRDDAIRKQEEEKRKHDRKQRHLQDDLRYALKKLPEPIDISMAYEDAVTKMEGLAEYKLLDDTGRRSAFAKFVKRQKVGVVFTIDWVCAVC
jgi:pre-mRNA-processing factor 40